VWHDSFTRVTWLIHTCDMTHSHVWHDSFTRVQGRIDTCDINSSWLTPSWDECEPRHERTCEGSLLADKCDMKSLRHRVALLADRQVCATTRIVHVCVNKDPSHVQRDVSFVVFRGLSWKETYLSEKREPFKNNVLKKRHVCATTCRGTHMSFTCHTQWHVHTHVTHMPRHVVAHTCHSHVWHDTLACVATLWEMRDMNSPWLFLKKNWQQTETLTTVCDDMTHSYVPHHTFTCVTPTLRTHFAHTSHTLRNHFAHTSPTLRNHLSKSLCVITHWYLSDMLWLIDMYHIICVCNAKTRVDMHRDTLTSVCKVFALISIIYLCNDWYLSYISYMYVTRSSLIIYERW